MEPQPDSDPEPMFFSQISVAAATLYYLRQQEIPSLPNPSPSTTEQPPRLIPEIGGNYNLLPKVFMVIVSSTSAKIRGNQRSPCHSILTPPAAKATESNVGCYRYPLGLSNSDGKEATWIRLHLCQKTMVTVIFFRAKTPSSILLRFFFVSNSLGEDVSLQWYKVKLLHGSTFVSAMIDLVDISFRAKTPSNKYKKTFEVLPALAKTSISIWIEIFK
ncbi:hypothetical protein PIB30_020796 [Stylosanthes scabra]|uniref:Uncharacterized protein n=1 Tax=Stylosanthes scabra TaxID=79078 RepID=A0ABU6S9B3_9FABA|nr:hypothetical protein [Stylosanthes scabra]